MSPSTSAYSQPDDICSYSDTSPQSGDSVLRSKNTLKESDDTVSQPDAILSLVQPEGGLLLRGDTLLQPGDTSSLSLSLHEVSTIPPATGLQGVTFSYFIRVIAKLSLAV